MSAIQAQIEKLQEKQKWLDKAHELAASIGYDTDNAVGEGALEQAIDYASSAHASFMGDGPYKPVDPDYFYPESDEALLEYIRQECFTRNVRKLPPALDLKAELKALSLSYKGNGDLKDAFAIVAKVAAKGGEGLEKLEDFAAALSGRGEAEQAVSKFAYAAVEARRALAL